MRLSHQVSYLLTALLVAAIAVACSGQPTSPTPAKSNAPSATASDGAKAASTSSTTTSTAKEAPKYPTKNVEIIAPYAAGGAQDQLARILAAYAQEKWKVAVTVTNKAGGGGFIGAAAAFATPADGYTMLVNGPTTYYTLAVTKQAPIKITDGTPVARIVINPLAFAVKADSKWNTLKDVVEDVKKTPDKYKAAASGAAGLTPFSTAKIWMSQGVEPSKIPVVVFDGGAPAHAAVAGSSCDFISNNISEAMSLYEAKKLKILAVTTPERSKWAPEAPTGKEAGFPEYNTLGFGALWGPNNLPEHVVSAWNGLIQEAVKDPKFQEQLSNAGFLPGYLGSKEFSDYLTETYNFASDIGKILKLEL